MSVFTPEQQAVLNGIGGASNGASGSTFDRLLRQESGGRQFDSAGNVITSSKGAIGIAQVMPATGPEAAKLAGLPWDAERFKKDPEYNKSLGRAYFDKQLSTFGDERLALAAYNAGPGAVARAIRLAERSGGDPLTYLPEETQKYVPAIMGSGFGVKSKGASSGWSKQPRYADPGFNKALEQEARLDDADESPVSTSVGRGFKNLTHSGGLFMDNLTGDSEGAAQRIKEKSEWDAANPAPRSSSEFVADWQKLAEDDYLGMLGSVVKNPGGALNQMVEQTPNSLPALALQIPVGIASSALYATGWGAPIAMGLQGLAAFVGNVLPEGGGYIEEQLSKAGINPQDTTAVAKWIAESRDKNIEGGLKKAGVISLADGATGYLGGKLIAGPAIKFAKAEEAVLRGAGVNLTDKAAVAAARATPAYKQAMAAPAQELLAATSRAQKTVRELGGFGLEAAGEGVGEYGGTYAANGDASVKDAVLESMMGAGTSAAMTGGNMALGAFKGPDASRAALQELAATPQPQAAPQSAPRPTPQPNSPLSNAAAAGQSAQPAQAPADPIAQRLSAAQSFVDDKAFIQAVRGAQGYGPESVTELLSAFAKERNPNLDPLIRDRALTDLEGFIQSFNSRPNFTFGTNTAESTANPGSQPGTQVAPIQQPGAVTTPTPRDDGRTLEGEIITRPEKMAGANPNQISAPPVLGLPTEEALKAKRDADAAYEQAYQDLVKAESLGAADAELQAKQQAIRDARAQSEQAEARLKEIEQAIEGNRAKQTAEKRRTILDAILADPNTANPAARLTAELARQGFRDTQPSADELAAIQRFEDIKAAQAELSRREAKPSGADDAARAAGMDSASVEWKRGKGLVAGKWAASIGDEQGGFFESAADALRSLQGFMDARVARSNEDARRHAAATTLAEKVKKGDAPTHAEWRGIFPQFSDSKTYLRQPEVSWFLVDYLGVPKSNIRGNIGGAAGNVVSDMGAKYPVVYLDRLAGVFGSKPEIRNDIDAAAHEAATSPLNDTPQPTEAQKEAGNYKVGRVKIQGMDISIENPQGSTRSGVSPDGVRWESTMANHYGYFPGTTASDGDHLDVFLTDGAEDAPVAWVIDQKNQDGSFDEQKIVLGPRTEEEARAAYLANYEPGWDGLGAISSMPIEAFKAWAFDGKKKRNPLAYVEPEADARKAPKYKAGDQVVPSLDVFDGDIVSTPDGLQWMAKVKRGRSIPVVPFEDGKPIVNADVARRFDLDETDVTHTGTNYYGHGGQPTPTDPREDFVNKKEQAYIAKRGGSAPPKAVEAVRVGAYREYDRLNATHQDPGQLPEAATPAVVAESIKKSAESTPLNIKEARAALLSEIDAAIANVGDKTELEAELQRAQAREFKPDGVLKRTGGAALRAAENDFEALKADAVAKAAKQIGFVTFDVPGDGKFKVVNTKAKLQEFRRKVETSPGFKEAPTKPPVMRREVEQGSYTPRDAILEGDYLNAYELAKLNGKPLVFRVSSGEVPSAYTDSATADGIIDGLAFVVAREAVKDGKWYVIDPATGMLLNKSGLPTKVAALTAAKAKVKGREDALRKVVADPTKAMPQSTLEAQWLAWAEEKDGRKLGDDADQDPIKSDPPANTGPAAESAPENQEPIKKAAVDYKEFERVDVGGGSFELRDGNMTVRVEPTESGKYQAAFRGAKSSPHLQGEQGAVDWADAYRAESVRAQEPAKAKESKPSVAQPSSLSDIFTGLSSRGLAKTRAEKAAAAHPRAEQIAYVQENFMDILTELEDAGIVKINCD